MSRAHEFASALVWVSMERRRRSRSVLHVAGELRRDQLLALMVAELDATRRGVGYVRIVELSDEARRNRRAVELLAAYRDGGEVVVEHTRIESFEEQARDRAALGKVFERGGPELQERHDAAYFMLGVEPGAFASIPFTDRSLVRDIITSWVRENLDLVPWPHVPGQSILLRGHHADVPFEWTLHRAVDDSVDLCGPLVHVVGVSYSMPQDLDARRQARLSRALDDKLPKLLGAAQPRRFSILVVEERDRVLSSPAHVAKALHVAAGGRKLPDAIYLVHTTIGDPCAMPIYEAGEWRFQKSDPFRWHQFSQHRVGQFNPLNSVWP